MTEGYDFDELVELFALNRPFESSAGSNLSCKVATVPLRKAIAMVIEDWADDKFRQLSAVIVRPSGSTIRSFEEIKKLYAKTEGAPAS